MKVFLKTAVKVLGIGLVVVVIIYLIAGFSGLIDLQFYRHFGKEKANIQREIFKENKSYIEGMVSDLAKYRAELTTEKDKTARKAIVDLITDKYANFNINNIENQRLRNFLIDIQNGNVSKYIDKEDQ